MGWWSRCQDGAIRSLWWGTGGAADLDSTSPAKNSPIDHYRAWYYMVVWRWLFCDYHHLSSILTKNSGFSMAFLYYVNIREIYPPTVAFRWDSHRFIASQADWEAKKLFVNTVRAQTSAPEVILLVKATTKPATVLFHWWSMKPPVCETSVSTFQPSTASFQTGRWMVGKWIMWMFKSNLSFTTYPLVNSHIAMENHYFQWVNPLFQWQFSIAMLNYQRVYPMKSH